MDTTEETKVFEVYMGTKEAGALKDSIIAGHATQCEGDDFYFLRLMMIPNVSYYLGKNPGSQNKYTVFTKSIRTGPKIRFQNPVGFAALSDDLRTHMEITLPLFKTSVFMNLFPKVFEKGA